MTGRLVNVKYLLDDFLSKQFLRFVITGGIAAAVNFIVGFLLAGLLPYHGDIVIGHIFGMVVAFILFGREVFEKNGGATFRQISVFVAVNLLALAQTYLVYYFFMHKVFPAIGYGFYPDMISRALAIITPIFTSFLGHKYFTFQQ